MTRPEIPVNDKIQMSLEYLFSNTELVIGTVQAELGYLMLNDADLRGLQPTFPDTVRYHVLRETLFDQQEQTDNSRSKFTSRFLGLVQKFADSGDRIEISDPFAYRYQRSTAFDGNSMSQIAVRSISYAGTIKVNKQRFNFDPEDRLVTVTTDHVYETGHVRYGSRFTLAPGKLEPSVMYQGAPESLAFIDPLQNPTVNMLKVIDAAIRLKDQ